MNPPNTPAQGAELVEAIELAKIGKPYRSYPGTGGIWAGRNEQFPDADFRDWGLGRATAVILNAATEGRLVPAAALTAAQAEIEELKAESERLRVLTSVFVDRAEYSDSYGVHGSGFMACHYCRGGGAPGVSLVHEATCPVHGVEEVANEWLDEDKQNRDDLAAATKRIAALESSLSTVKGERNDLIKRLAEAETDARNAHVALSTVKGETLEEAAKIADELSDKIMRKAERHHRKEEYDRYEALECEASIVADVAAKIRKAIRTIPAQQEAKQSSGDSE